MIILALKKTTFMLVVLSCQTFGLKLILEIQKLILFFDKTRIGKREKKKQHCQ